MSDTLGSPLQVIPAVRNRHSPCSPLYSLLARVARREVEERFQDKEPTPKAFGPFEKLIFPYHKMGNRDALNLFDLDELIIFSFYGVNRNRYYRVLDLGANLAFTRSF